MKTAFIIKYSLYLLLAVPIIYALPKNLRFLLAAPTSILSWILIDKNI